MKLFHKILTIVTEALTAVDNFLIENTILKNYLGELVKRFGLFLYKDFYNETKRYALIIFFRVIPRIMVCCALILDVFLFSKFNFVYKTAPFLLIPLLEKYLVYRLNTFYNDNLQVIDEVLEISDKNTAVSISAEKAIELLIFDKENIIKKTLVVKLLPTYVIMFKNTDFDYNATIAKFENFFAEVIFPIKIFLLLYNLSRAEILKLFDIILLVIYIIIWSYIFCYTF